MKNKSLEEVHSSIDTTIKKGFFRKLLAFFGPAYLISVGYMDPGNWATDIAAGSGFGYSLLWVLLMSNFMALLLQSLSARLGLVRGMDLAQASRETYPKYVNFFLYIFAEIAIAACDLAEVLGMAIGLNLLFGIPLIWAVVITIFDTFLLLFLIHKGMRALEAFIVSLIAIIGLALLIEVLFAKPDAGELVKGLIPILPTGNMLFITIGIIGATVMPHNLYLHSSLVQTRKYDRTSKGIKEAIKFNFIDSTIALNLAFFVNAAILILAAATFYKSGMFGVGDISDAHKFLEPLLGTKWAPVLFAIALIAAGQSSTITGTLAGQIVMEGYLDLRIQPWIRRIITRVLAILPAFLAILWWGNQSIGQLLVISQVVLSLQLGFAVIPLIHFVSNKEKMGEFAIGKYFQLASWVIAVIIVGLNAKLLYEQILQWYQTFYYPNLILFTAVPISIGGFVLLIYVTIKPFVAKAIIKSKYLTHGEVGSLKITKVNSYKRIAVAIDFSDIDNNVINHALTLGGNQAEYLLIHVVESAGAIFLGSEIQDQETKHDSDLLQSYISSINEEGYTSRMKMGFGSPKKIIPEFVNEFDADLLVMGAHGHKLLKDILLGSTLDSVRHDVEIPVMIVRT